MATGLVGFLDAVYLTARHFLGIEINCNLIQGCEQVLNSSYSAVGPVPLALALAGVGLLVTGVLLYLQIFGSGCSVSTA